jgi:hypothetical protein
MTRPAITLISLLTAAWVTFNPLHAGESGNICHKPESIAGENAYFGDLHVHTSFSLDSYVFGNRNDPAIAYAFAAGEPVLDMNGRYVQLNRPLDFIAVSDHAEGFGETFLCQQTEAPEYRSDFCKQVRNGDMRVFQALADSTQVNSSNPFTLCKDNLQRCITAGSDAWEISLEKADKAYKPGVLTTFFSFEYSPAVGREGHLHRNVIFDSKPNLLRPIDSYNAPTVVQLWDQLEKSCADQCQAMTIPHNTNYSWGLAFNLQKRDGTQFTINERQQRERLEHVVEIFQSKGSSECNPQLGSVDEECFFEALFLPCTEGQTEHCAMPGSFARDGLHSGLSLSHDHGFNPMQIGFVGGTDTHNAFAGNTNSADFRGNLGTIDSSPEKRFSNPNLRRFNPGGLTGAWASENNRSAIFGSIRQRRTFATSGPRISVDLVAYLQSNLQQSISLMGGELEKTKPNTRLALEIYVQEDPLSEKLQTVQIVRGRYVNGKSEDRVFSLPMTSVTDCSRGLKAVRWTDDEFDPDIPAFYYVRAIEAPSIRWHIHDDMQYQPETVRHRAWSSPVWYQP